MRVLISLWFVYALFLSVPYGGTSCSALSSEGVHDVAEGVQSVSSMKSQVYQVAAFESAQRGVEMRKEDGYQVDGIAINAHPRLVKFILYGEQPLYLKVLCAYRSRIVTWTGYGEVHQFFKA